MRLGQGRRLISSWHVWSRIKAHGEGFNLEQSTVCGSSTQGLENREHASALGSLEYRLSARFIAPLTRIVLSWMSIKLLADGDRPPPLCEVGVALAVRVFDAVHIHSLGTNSTSLALGPCGTSQPVQIRKISRNGSNARLGGVDSHHLCHHVVRRGCKCFTQTNSG